MRVSLSSSSSLTSSSKFGLKMWSFEKILHLPSHRSERDTRFGSFSLSLNSDRSLRIFPSKGVYT